MTLSKLRDLAAKGNLKITFYDPFPTTNRRVLYPFRVYRVVGNRAVYMGRRATLEYTEKLVKHLLALQDIKDGKF